LTHFLRSPISPGIPFLGETSPMKDFKPFKIALASDLRKRDEYQPTESLPNQFLSHYQKEYMKPKVRPDCPVPARIETIKILTATATAN